MFFLEKMAVLTKFRGVQGQGRPGPARAGQGRGQGLAPAGPGLPALAGPWPLDPPKLRKDCHFFQKKHNCRLPQGWGGSSDERSCLGCWFIRSRLYQSDLQQFGAGRSSPSCLETRP